MILRDATLELLSDKHRLDDFSCGKPALDAWFARYAMSNQAQDFTRVIVVQREGRVIGFYGLAPGSIDAAAVPRSIRTGQPPDPIPVFLLGQLAVDVRHAGQGIGTFLVKDAFHRCLRAVDIAGGRAIVVRAVDDDAEAYWRSWDFRPSRDNPSILLRSTENIRGWLSTAPLATP